MPKRTRKLVEELNHAFELALIIIGIIYGLIAQYATTEPVETLPPIISDMHACIFVVYTRENTKAILNWAFNRKLNIHPNTHTYSRREPLKLK